MTVALCSFPTAGGIAFGAIAAALPADGAPTQEVQLLPLGQIQARDGRRWSIDGLAHAQNIVEASRAYANAVDPVVDYDHQADLAAPKGGRAEAAGWIKELQARPDGIWARVEWTAEAAAKLQTKAYRYISPTFQYDAQGRVLRVLRAGLTNTPALDLPALAAVTPTSTPTVQEANMEPWLKELLTALGLPEDCEKARALAHAARLRSDTAIAAAVAGGLGLAAATVDQVNAAITALKAEPDPSKFVPVATYTAVASQLAELQAGVARKDAEAAVDEAAKAGKVTPALRDWALKYAARDLAGFKAYAAAHPVILAPGAAIAGQPPGGPALLDEADKAVCKAMGLTHEEYLKHKGA